MHDKLFESALGISAPWSVKSVEFDAAAKRLTVLIDFTAGTRFAVPGHEGVHPVHDTVAKDYRHLNFFQHECHLRVRMPRVKLPDVARIRSVSGWRGLKKSARASPLPSVRLSIADTLPATEIKAKVTGWSGTPFS